MSPVSSFDCGCLRDNVKVGIVGGGIGGFALGIGLQNKGIRFKVYERDRTFDSRCQGYGLTLQQGGKAIKTLGLVDKVAQYGGWSSRHFIFDSEGNVVLFWGPTWNAREWERKRAQQAALQDGRQAQVGAIDDTTGQSLGNKSWQGTHNLHIPRQELRRVLYESVNQDSIAWNAGVSHVEEFQSPCHTCGTSGRLLRVHFSDPARTPDVVSALVASDGIHSRIREQIYGDEKKYLNVFVMLGLVDGSNFPLLQERVFQMSDGATRMFVMPFDHSGKSMWQLSFPMPDEQAAKDLGSRSMEGLLEKALELCGDWQDPVPDMLRQTVPGEITGYPVYDRDLKLREEGDNQFEFVTMIGDAMHCMSPFKGQGANQALLDGVVLAERFDKCVFPEKHWRPRKKTRKEKWEMNQRLKRERKAMRKAALLAAAEKEAQAENQQGGSVAPKPQTLATQEESIAEIHQSHDAEASMATVANGEGLTQPNSAHLTQPNSAHLTQLNSAHLTQPNSDHLTQPNSGHLTQPNSDHLVQPTGEHPNREPIVQHEQTPNNVTKSTSSAISKPENTNDDAASTRTNNKSTISKHSTVMSTALAESLRAFEEEIVKRSTPKVIGSRVAVDVLHRANFIVPEEQAKRRGFAKNILDRVMLMREARVGAWCVQEEDHTKLDRIAFTSDYETIEKELLQLKKLHEEAGKNQ